MVMLMLFLLPLCLELLITETPAWRYRRKGAFTVALLLLFSGPAVFLLWPTAVSCLLVAINAYRIINLGRILEDRMHDTYLHHQIRRTSRWLSLGVIGCLGLMYVPWLAAVANVTVTFATIGVIAAIVTGLSLRHQLTTSRTGPIKLLPTALLPTLTVAIPARDETDDLEACLRSLLASDYPKLEILVLDDHSRNKRTAEIIRGFAHEGVRFLPAEPARRNWLAKNLAYQTLAKQANGELVVFCGVDIRFQPDSLRQLVSQLDARKKQMLSVVPLNTGRFSVIQSMRYGWELALPRRLFNRPAVLSSSWIIRREALKRAGSFAAVTRMVVPEAHFAHQFLKADGYGLLRSGNQLGITSEKSEFEQTATAIRTRYPQVHKRVELTALTTIVSFVCFVFPIGGLIYGLATMQVGLIALCLVAYLGNTVTYIALIRASYRTVTGWALLALPIAAGWDSWLLNRSMWRYEFATVLWKGRDITPSVMHKTPHLPKLD